MRIKVHHKLPKPTGPYTVGCTNFLYEYNLAGKKRLIPCLCYYPAKSVSGKKLKKYVDERILPGTGGIETNSYVNAAACDGKYPLILFNHALALFLEANTVQCEELASHGYIVLSVGHEGDGSYELPSGEILSVTTTERSADNAPDSLETFLTYADWLKKDGEHASMQKHQKHYQSVIDQVPDMVARSDTWTKDSLAALDTFLLATKRADNKLHNHIAREHIGTFGYSFGGPAALNLALESDDIKCVVDLDGFFYSPSWQRSITKPVMLLQNDSTSLLAFPFLHAQRDAYLATVKRTVHGNFADFNEFMAENQIVKAEFRGKEIELPILGEIDPSAMEGTMNTLLLDFFDKYLKGKDSRVLDTDNLPSGVTVLKKA